MYVHVCMYACIGKLTARLEKHVPLRLISTKLRTKRRKRTQQQSGCRMRLYVCMHIYLVLNKMVLISPERAKAAEEEEELDK